MRFWILLSIGVFVFLVMKARPQPKVFVYTPPESHVLTEEEVKRFWAKRREWLEGMPYLSRRSKDSDPIEEGDTFALGYSNEDFEAALVALFHPGHFFPVNLAGASHENDDGSRRDVVIALCRELDELTLEHDVNNAHSKTAVAVLQADGLQLGWLPDHIGKEVLSKQRNGWGLRAVFREPHFHPERKVVVGGAIYLFEPGVDKAKDTSISSSSPAPAAE
jgi:hypothetical protein